MSDLSADPMAVVGLGATGAGLGLAAVYAALDIPRRVRRRLRLNRRFKTAGMAEPNRLRLVPPGPRTASPPPPAGASEGGSTHSAGLRTANARVGSPADLTRANHSSPRDLPSQGAVEGAGSPDHAQLQRRGRGSRGRGGLRSVPASTTTDRDVLKAVLGAISPGSQHRFQGGPVDLSNNRTVGHQVRPPGHPHPENTTIPRPLLGQEQPGDHDNWRG